MPVCFPSWEVPSPEHGRWGERSEVLCPLQLLWQEARLFEKGIVYSGRRTGELVGQGVGQYGKWEIAGVCVTSAAQQLVQEDQ